LQNFIEKAMQSLETKSSRSFEAETKSRDSITGKESLSCPITSTPPNFASPRFRQSQGKERPICWR